MQDAVALDSNAVTPRQLARQYVTDRAGAAQPTLRRSTPQGLVLIMHHPTRVSDS